MTTLARRIMVMFAVSLHLIGDLAAVPVAYRLKSGDGSGFGLAVLFGLLLGQISLVAAYLAWGTDHWVARWAKSCLLALLAWYVITVGAVSTGDSFEVSSIERLLAIVVATLSLFMSIPYWAIRALCRSRFEVLPDDQLSAGLSKPQFRVRDLLSWTAAAAVVFGILCSRIGRETWVSKWSISSGDLAGISMWMSAFAVLCVLVAIPTAWACLGKHKLRLRPVGVGIYAAIVVASEWAVLYGVAGDERPRIAMVGLNLGILCEVIFCSLLLRICGYRLHLYTPRRDRTRSGPNAEAAAD